MKTMEDLYKAFELENLDDGVTVKKLDDETYEWVYEDGGTNIVYWHQSNHGSSWQFAEGDSTYNAQYAHACGYKD